MNSKDVLKGQLDVPLSEEGIRQAYKLAKQLKGKGLEMLAHSDLKRAKKTSKIIATILKIKSEDHEGLRPWDFGDLTGKPVESSKSVLKRHVRIVPGRSLPGGESFNAFKNRFLECVSKMLRENKGNRIGIVTHSRDDKLLDAWEKEGFPKDFSIDNNEFLKTFDKKGLKPGEFEDKVIKL